MNLNAAGAGCDLALALFIPGVHEKLQLVYTRYVVGLRQLFYLFGRYVGNRLASYVMMYYTVADSTLQVELSDFI